MKTVIPGVAMAIQKGLWGIALFVAIGVPASLDAGSVTIPNRFVNGSLADANQVNENFDVLAVAVNDNDARIKALEEAVRSLREELTAANTAIADLQMQTSNIQTINPFVSVEMDPLNGLRGPHVLFTGANVHIRSGSEATDDGGDLTGLGNLVVGYNEPPDNEARIGSHNLVIGREHRYSSFGGLVAGFRNTISGEEASVSGGTLNEASGNAASVSGGRNNTAGINPGNVNCFNPDTNEPNDTTGASVSGGENNIACGLSASVSGGGFNRASKRSASVSGGSSNTASGDFASVSGGGGNTASGMQASVSGGGTNTASGLGASVSGGSNNTASNATASVSGGGFNTASSPSASVSGGDRNTASGIEASVSGGRCNLAIGDGASVSGGGLAFDTLCVQGVVGNEASGQLSSVSGGSANTASNLQSSITGGQNTMSNGDNTTTLGNTGSVFVDTTVLTVP